MSAKPKKERITARIANTSVTVQVAKPSTERNDQRNADGRFATGSTNRGYSAPATIDLARARKTLNLMTIDAMIDAFRRGGREAIDKVMRNAPAQFLKMAVLLVPRELEVTHSGGVKGMSDEQLERGIEALEALMAKRQGDSAKVIEGSVAEGASATED